MRSAFLLIVFGFLILLISSLTFFISDMTFGAALSKVSIISGCVVAVLAIGVPVIVFLSKAIHKLMSPRRHARAQMIMDIFYDRHTYEVFVHPRFRNHPEQLSFQSGFIDLLEDHVADNAALSSALGTLDTVRAREQWEQLEDDERFSYDEDRRFWHLEPEVVGEDIWNQVRLLTTTMTFDQNKPIYAAHTRIVDHPGERAVLMELMNAVKDSEHYGFEDFLSLATAPLGPSGVNESLHEAIKSDPMLSVAAKIVTEEAQRMSTVRIWYWRSVVEKIKNNDGLSAEIVTLIVGDEVERELVDRAAERKADISAIGSR